MLFVMMGETMNNPKYNISGEIDPDGKGSKFLVRKFVKVLSLESFDAASSIPNKCKKSYVISKHHESKLLLKGVNVMV